MGELKEELQSQEEKIADLERRKETATVSELHPLLDSRSRAGMCLLHEHGPGIVPVL